MAAIRVTRQSVETAYTAAFPADNVRVTRQSVEVAYPAAFPPDNIRMTRQSVEIAILPRPSVPWQLIGQRTQEI
jgi:hypothetical protein